MLDLAAFYANEKIAPNATPETEKSPAEETKKLLDKGRDLYRNGDLEGQICLLALPVTGLLGMVISQPPILC